MLCRVGWGWTGVFYFFSLAGWVAIVYRVGESIHHVTFKRAYSPTQTCDTLGT